MKERRKARRSTRILIIILIALLIGDYFLYKNRKSEDGFTLFIIWCAFTIFLLYGIIYNLVKNSELKKTIEIKEKGLLQPINTKIIRFEYEAILGLEGYYHIVSSNGQTEFSSESIKGKIIGYNTIKLIPLYNIGFKYNILEIEKTIKELDEIQTHDDIKNYIKNNSSSLFNSFGESAEIITKGSFYDKMLSQINECKEYLKEISKNPEFKNSYLEYKNYQIHIGDTITVYIDPNDTTIYLVDTDFLYN